MFVDGPKVNKTCTDDEKCFHNKIICVFHGLMGLILPVSTGIKIPDDLQQYTEPE